MQRAEQAVALLLACSCSGGEWHETRLLQNGPAEMRWRMNENKHMTALKYGEGKAYCRYEGEQR